LRLFSFGGYGLALAALALVVFGATECPPFRFTMTNQKEKKSSLLTFQNYCICLVKMLLFKAQNSDFT